MMATRYGIWAGLCLGAFLIVANVSYVYLVATFRYDDILREPMAVILEEFSAGGAELVLAWAAFSWSSLIFVVAACLVGRALTEEHGQIVWMATASGVASGLLQAAGSFRWVFAVPSMANAYAGAHPLQKLTIAEAFNALHQYVGVALTEHLGQMLLVGWTAGIAAACWRVGGSLRFASYIGMLSVPLWLIAQTELYATAIPQVPAIETGQIAFLIWMLFVLALACGLMFRLKRRRRTAAPAVAAAA